LNLVIVEKEFGSGLKVSLHYDFARASGWNLDHFAEPDLGSRIFLSQGGVAQAKPLAIRAALFEDFLS